MLFATSIQDLVKCVKENNITEAWVIARSLKGGLPQIEGVTSYHVPQLSPSPELFHKYCNEKNAGRWNQEAFQHWYVPQFISDIKGNQESRTILNKLYNAAKKKNIAIVCFCPDESMCHRSIILGLMYGMYESRGVTGTCNGSNYMHYFELYQAQGVVNNEAESLPEQKKNFKVMGFTGPRAKKLYGYEKVLYTPLVEKLKEKIKYYYNTYGTDTFVSGGAQGFDQIAFWAVNSCKREGMPLKNILCLPFPGQDTPWRDEGLFGKKEYNTMLRLADEVQYCTDKKPNDKSSAVMSLFYRNHVIVDKSDIVFALFHDDSWKMNNAGGGTGECIRYVSQSGKPFVQLDPNGLNMISDI